MIIKQAQPYKERITALLESEKLPVDDLPAMLDNFIAAIQDNEVTGVAGLEIYGTYGLLRSLAVNPAQRNQGIAGKLLERTEAIGVQKGLQSIFLLTETASDYFKLKGYRTITRAEVPLEIQRSSAYSHVCPVSAIVMKKNL